MNNNDTKKIQDTRFKIQVSGFSALEMLLVLGLIVLLLGAAALVGFRDQPAKNRNTERRNEVNAIKDALTQWILDNNSTSPPSIPLLETCIGTKITPPACFDLTFLTPQYLNTIPEDPKNTNGQSNVGYTIMRDIVQKVIIIYAPLVENSETISAQIQYGITGAPNSSAIKCADPKTFRIDGSGIPFQIKIADYVNFTPPATLIIMIKFQEPVPGGCSAPLDAGQHYLDHIPGSEQLMGGNYYVKFNRGIIESCVQSGDSLTVAVKDSSGNELFTCQNKIIVQ